MGIKNKQYTRPLMPANVYLKIVLKHGEKPIIINPWSKEDYKLLEKKFPKVFEDVKPNIKFFKPYQIPEWVKSEDHMGYFEFEAPISKLWDYLITAVVEKDERSVLDEGSDNGEGKQDFIYSNVLNQTKGDYGPVIVAFFDKWLPEPPPKKLRDTKPPTPKEIEDMMKYALIKK
ncbi:hypothetical protein D6745_03125 [Candidatus Woesearchaeota archaeon]|nr:MAG: hypothetical protein D6745_03125 [Candidatus Woesearchaeota archaeon]